MRGYVEAMEARAKYGELALNEVERAITARVELSPRGDGEEDEDA
jgi:hypothetical protein